MQRAQTAEAIAAWFPDGGLALWVELPAEVPAQALFDEALSQAILVGPGWLFSNSRRYDQFLRINCGWPCDTRVLDGLERLGGITTRLLSPS